ncbi:unnamed protein product [Discosporangium mesarthrocarpum]
MPQGYQHQQFFSPSAPPHHPQSHQMPNTSMGFTKGQEYVVPTGRSGSMGMDSNGNGFVGMAAVVPAPGHAQGPPAQDGGGATVGVAGVFGMGKVGGADMGNGSCRMDEAADEQQALVSSSPSSSSTSA